MELKLWQQFKLEAERKRLDQMADLLKKIKLARLNGLKIAEKQYQDEYFKIKDRLSN